MARPKLPESAKGKPVKIYLRNALRKDADKLAFKRGVSLSHLINDLLRNEVESTAKRAA